MTSWQIKQQLEQIKEIEIFCPTWSHPPECNEAGLVTSRRQPTCKHLLIFIAHCRSRLRLTHIQRISEKVHISHINPEVDRSCVYHTRPDIISFVLCSNKETFNPESFMLIFCKIPAIIFHVFDLYHSTNNH